MLSKVPQGTPLSPKGVKSPSVPGPLPWQQCGSCGCPVVSWTLITKVWAADSCWSVQQELHGNKSPMGTSLWGGTPQIGSVSCEWVGTHVVFHKSELKFNTHKVWQIQKFHLSASQVPELPEEAKEKGKKISSEKHCGFYESCKIWDILNLDSMKSYFWNTNVFESFSTVC